MLCPVSQLGDDPRESRTFNLKKAGAVNPNTYTINHKP